MTATMTSPIAALRASLSSASLLGFTARAGAAGNGPQAKAAFVGGPTITVTSAADSGPGTLRDALAQNQTNGGGSDIVFSPSLAGSTIALQSSLSVSNFATIDGGSNNITISGGNAVTDFVVTGQQRASIENLTIADGNGVGAAGTPGNTASASTVNGGQGGDAAGGIFVQSDGSVFLQNDHFVNDTATGGQGGAGVATFIPGQGPAFGAGGPGGNAAGAVYVEPGTSTVNNAYQLTSSATTATAGAPGAGVVGPSIAGTAYPVSNDSTINNADTPLSAPCYCTGTRIRTARGDIAVESLAAGDLAVTASGEHRPVHWLGHRTIDCRNYPRANEVMPIRISAHAFGANRPARDLFVSPGHAICVDVIGEVLIPASALVNGSTIQQVELDEVTYWHVELESHDVILAENLPAESYLDMGNRGFFREENVVDLAAGPDAEPYHRTHADFCRPFHGGGPLVAVVRAQLQKRAEATGWALTSALDLYLEVDGQRVDPIVRGLAARFQVPAGANDVWLMSPTARPSDTMGSSDTRDLGLYIGALRINDGFELRDIAIDHPLLCIGFHEVENGCRRWTTGRARLPAALWDGCYDGFFLRLDLAGLPVLRWAAPAGPAAHPRLSIVA